jgi:hypothetical protein
MRDLTLVAVVLQMSTNSQLITYLELVIVTAAKPDTAQCTGLILDNGLARRLPSTAPKAGCLPRLHHPNQESNLFTNGRGFDGNDSTAIQITAWQTQK